LFTKEELLKWLEEDEEFRARLAMFIMETPVLRELRALREDFNRLAKSVDENTEATRALQKQMVLLQEQVAEHSKAIRALQEQMILLQEQVAEQSKAIRALQEQMVSLQEQVAEHSKAIRAFQEQMVSLQKQVAEHSKAIRALQEQVAEHSKAIRSLQEQVAEHSKVIIELQKRVDEHSKVIIGLQERMDEHSKVIMGLQERVDEHSKAIIGLQERVNEHSRRIDRLTATIGALGRRWGLMSEEAFRAAMAGMLDEFGFKVVGKLVLKDDWGIVDPDELGALYEYDLCITKDGKEWVVEIKSHVDWEDVAILKRKIRLYERCRGTRPEVAIVSPSVEEEARAKAEKAGIKVFTYEEEDTYLDLLR